MYSMLSDTRNKIFNTFTGDKLSVMPCVIDLYTLSELTHPGKNKQLVFGEIVDPYGPENCIKCNTVYFN